MSQAIKVREKAPVSRTVVTTRLKTVPPSEFFGLRILDSAQNGWKPSVEDGEIYRDAPSQRDSLSHFMYLLEKDRDPDAQSWGANNIAEYVATEHQRRKAIAALAPLLDSPFQHVASSARDALGELGAHGFEPPVTPGWYEHG